MPKKFIKRFLPNEATLKEHKSLGLFGRLILAPSLWHLNKRSVSGAFAVGLFCAFVPVPFQMILAIAGALLFRVNLAISVALVWITNPVTMPPIFYGAYLVGAWVLDTPVMDIEFSLTVEWLKTGLLLIWQPFLLGCFIFAATSAIVGWVIIRVIWRQLVIKNWHKRKLERDNNEP